MLTIKLRKQISFGFASRAKSGYEDFWLGLVLLMFGRVTPLVHVMKEALH